MLLHLGQDTVVNTKAMHKIIKITDLQCLIFIDWSPLLLMIIFYLFVNAMSTKIKCCT